MTGLRLNVSKYDAKNLKSALSPASTETRQNKNPNAKKIALEKKRKNKQQSG